MPCNSSVGLSLATPLFCFFLSGAAGLIYQIAWTKSLALLFGYSAYALGTVLSVFMGGLGLGSYWIGKKTQGVANSLAVYGWMEIAIAATGALSLAGLRVIRAAYLASYAHASESKFSLLLLRFVGAAIVLFVPTFLMGGTLPILIRHVTRQSSELAARVSRLYAVNTFGAVVGTVAAGFLLLPELGLKLTVLIAVFLNVCAGICALYSARKAPRTTEGKTKSGGDSQQIPSRAANSQSSASITFLLATFALVGATAITYEISWTRLLATILGSSTYAFTLMLATFLVGIVIGSFLFEKWCQRDRTVTIEIYSWTQFGIAAAALLFLFLFREFPNLVPPVLRTTHNSFAGLILLQFLMSALAMLPAAIIFGFNFPAVVVLISMAGYKGNGSSHSVGKAYAANTCGAIIAAVTVGFLLLPRLGGFRVVALTAALNLFLAAALHFRSRSRRWAFLVVQAVTLGAIAYAAWSPHFYNRALASFGAVLYGGFHSDRLTVEEIADTEDVVFLEDGINATIAVTRTEDYVALKTNGKVDASNVDDSTQLLLGDLGAVFHPHPRRALIIGFGGGMTASAVSRFPDVERIDSVEIEPAVLRAAPYLERLNRGVTSDPRLHVFYDDARNFVQTSNSSYDLIISEPSNPWIAGVASLYTAEFYATLRQHLAPGGIFVQWVQAYSLQQSDLQTILATLAPHFVDVSLWHSAGRDLLLLGRTETSGLNFDRSRALWSNPSLQSDFSELHLTRPESWPVYFRWNDAEVRAFAAGAEQNTDDHTILEYRSPRALLQDGLAKDLDNTILRTQKELLPGNLAAREMEEARWGSAESALELKSNRSLEYVQAIWGNDLSNEKALLLARGYLQAGDAKSALENLQGYNPGKNNLYTKEYWLAVANRAAGSNQLAFAQLEGVLDYDPRNRDALRELVQLAIENKDWLMAIAAQEKLIEPELNPVANDFCELGDLHLRNGDLHGAYFPLEEGIKREPYSYLCHRDLGELQRASGRNGEAQENLEFVIRYFPEADAKTYASLALVFRIEHNSDKERETIRKGLRIFPGEAMLQRMQQQLK